MRLSTRFSLPSQLHQDPASAVPVSLGCRPRVCWSITAFCGPGSKCPPSYHALGKRKSPPLHQARLCGLPHTPPREAELRHPPAVS